ncbi:MAG: cyclic nucleotide-binding domain-containing protein [Acidimicrobiia bacterium]
MALGKKSKVGSSGEGDTTVLDSVALFAGLSSRERSQIAARMIERTFADGANAVLEGTHGIGFFVITDGTAEAIVNGESRRTLGKGDYFGEIAMLAGDDVRSATVVARGELHCLAMTEWEFKPFLKEFPAVAKIIESTMAQRLESDGTPH